MLMLILLGSTLSLFESVAANDPPNVIVIVADDLGYADVGFHGSRIKTPRLDQLAAAGTRLEQFYVQPVCSPTRAALMTGRYPIRYGLQVGVVRPWADYGLPLTERLLPQLLQDVGYKTFICGKWHLGEVSPEYLPTARGFDHQYGHFLGAIDYFTHQRDGGHDWHRDDQPNYDEGYSTHLIANEAVRVIENHDVSHPLFLYVPFNAPHTPLQVPDEYTHDYEEIENQARRKFAGMVACLDESIGKIFDAATAHLSVDNTMIFFCSDNGGIPRLGSNGPLKGKKGTVYEGGVRVPAVVYWKGKIPAGAEVDQPLHIVDLLPTIATLAGASTESCLPLDGIDAWSTMKENANPSQRLIVHNITPSNGAIRLGEWKLVYSSKPNNNRANDKWELYNIVADPSEKQEVASEHPEKLNELKQLYSQLVSEAVEPLNKRGGQPKDFQVPKIWGHR